MTAAATAPQLLRLGHSPDPDDAFMFYGMAKDLIPQGPYRFEHILQDIQTLNQRSRKGELEVSAISIHAYPYVADKYALMSCGSSMGDQYGPMVVATRPMALSELKGKTIVLSLGFANQLNVNVPDGVAVKVEAQGTRINIQGADKQSVGQLAAEIRKLRKPEPYKGKGVRYVGEVVKKKLGKQFAGAGAK